jgi:hypothetical protein
MRHAKSAQRIATGHEKVSGDVPCASPDPTKTVINAPPKLDGRIPKNHAFGEFTVISLFFIFSVLLEIESQRYIISLNLPNIILSFFFKKIAESQKSIIFASKSTVAGERPVH